MQTLHVNVDNTVTNDIVSKLDLNVECSLFLLCFQVPIVKLTLMSVRHHLVTTVLPVETSLDSTTVHVHQVSCVLHLCVKKFF